MIRTRNIGGFFVFLMSIILLWFGIIVTNKWCIMYWFKETDNSKKLISVLPLTKIGWILFLIYNGLSYIGTIAHLRAALCDPGIITNDIRPPGEMSDDEIKGCKRCRLIWKPMRAHHCSECNVWIFKMDHHCPWINNCVGVRNNKYFFLFTFYVGVGTLLTISILITCFIMLLKDDEKIHVRKKYYALSFFLWICVFVIAILFAFFTLELVGEQLESFQDNQTYIDDLKDLYGEPLTLLESLFVYLGEDWWFWLIPTRPVQQVNYWERLYKRQELVAKLNKKIPAIDYDPNRKQKAIEYRLSRVDKIIFFCFTALTFATCYYFYS